MWVILSGEGRIGMFVTVLFFAGARERVGVGRVELDVSAGADLGAVVDRAIASTGVEYELPENVMLARNGVYADRSTVLSDGDEIAVIPPVSGGSECRLGCLGYGRRNRC